MLEDDQERRFRYKGANKGDLTIKFLFSNWGSGERAFDAEFGSLEDNSMEHTTMKVDMFEA